MIRPRFKQDSSGDMQKYANHYAHYPVKILLQVANPPGAECIAHKIARRGHNGEKNNKGYGFAFTLMIRQQYRRQRECSGHVVQRNTPNQLILITLGKRHTFQKSMYAKTDQYT